jgi:hypothetical protein
MRLGFVPRSDGDRHPPWQVHVTTQLLTRMPLDPCRQPFCLSAHRSIYSACAHSFWNAVSPMRRIDLMAPRVHFQRPGHGQKRASECVPVPALTRTARADDPEVTRSPLTASPSRRGRLEKLSVFLVPTKIIGSPLACDTLFRRWYRAWNSRFAISGLRFT